LDSLDELREDNPKEYWKLINSLKEEEKEGPKSIFLWPKINYSNMILRMSSIINVTPHIYIIIPPNDTRSYTPTVHNISSNKKSWTV
jgi:hypothetical protein